MPGRVPFLWCRPSRRGLGHGAGGSGGRRGDEEDWKKRPSGDGDRWVVYVIMEDNYRPFEL